MTALALMGACKSRPAPEPASGSATASKGLEAATQKTLRVTYFEPDSYDPALLHGGPGKDLAENLFEGLCSHAADGTIIPGQAHKWTASDDGMTWTFELRDGLSWSDGTAITAEDFVWSLRRAINPQTGNPRAGELWPIKNAEAITKGTIKTLESLGVAADGKKQVVITLENPFPYVVNLMASGYTLPVPRHIVTKHGKKWTRPENLVTNGPYIVQSHKHGQEMKLTANSKYWAAETVKISHVKYRYTNKNQLAYQWFKLGEIDWSMSLLPVEEAQRMRKERNPALRIHDYDGLLYLLLDTAKAPFDDVLVRRAFDLAIDRPRLTRQVTGQGERPATTFVPIGMTTSRPPKRLRFDPDEARKLLAQSRFGSLEPRPEITLLFNTNAKNQRIAEFLQRNLKENLGVTVVLHNVEWKTFLERLGKHEFQMCQLVMGGGFNPSGYLKILETNSPDNRSRWSNADFDAATREARKATTKKAVDAAITKAMAIADREAPLPTLYRLTRQTLLRPELSGHVANSENRHLLRWMAWGEK